MGIPMPESDAERTTYRLLSWFSPAFPVGSFSYSSGLETLIADAVIGDAAGLQAVIGDLLAHGSLRTDALLFAAAHRAAGTGDVTGAGHVEDLAAALPLSRQRRLETIGQGEAFVAAVAAWDRRSARPEAGCGPAYPVAAGQAAAEHDLPLRTALIAYLNAAVAALVSVGVRLIPIGQSNGVRVMAALEPAVADAVEEAGRSTLADLGGASFVADIAAMRHETLATRIFRS